MSTKSRSANPSFMKSTKGARGAVLALLLLPLAAGAGGVVTNCTEADLRAAVAGGGVVTFACDSTIILTSTITNDIDLALDGTGHQVTISGGNAVRVFRVNTNVHFTVINLTISGGRSQGGSAILNLGGTVNLTGITLSANAASPWGEEDLTPTVSGGAILNRGGSVNATNCSFLGNIAQTPFGWPDNGSFQALVYGGAIRNEAGSVALQGCVFAGNQASGGSAYHPLPGDTGLGGAIYNSGTVTVDLCTFETNTATGGAGGEAWVSDACPGGSGGEGSGGAIYSEGTLTVDRTTFSGNSATGGSGGNGANGDFLYFQDGWPGGAGAGAYGGAIYGSGVFSRSLFVSNVVAGGAGGGGGSGASWVDIGGNGADGGSAGSGLGGAISGGASLVNCTIASNIGRGGSGGWGGNGYGIVPGASGAGGDGGNGGSGVGGVSGAILRNCTVVGNLGQAGSSGSGGDGYAGSGTPGTSGTASGGTGSGGVNTLIASNTPAGGDTFADPKLGPLADNGGPTLTMALLPGSPAIDTGDTSLAPANDQRGFPRPAGLAADIGAYEYGSVIPAIAINLSGTTNLSILGTGNAGQPWRLLSSPDLTSWVPVATNQIGGDGTVLFYDTCGPGSACRFYRLVMP